MRTLEQIIEAEKKKRCENCEIIVFWKEFILSTIKHRGLSLYEQLERYVEKSNKDVLFDDVIVLACWELINER